MPPRDEYEADLFRRYESRIVALELRCTATEDSWKRWQPIVEKLNTDKMIADAIAERIVAQGKFRLTRVQVALAVCALIVPPVLGALLSAFLVTH